MNSTTSIRIIRTISLSFLLAVGLLVVGCDSGGSNGGQSDRWTGNWKQTDAESLFEGDANFALSLSKEEVKTTERAGCTTRTMEVTNVEVVNEGSDAEPTIVDITLGNGDVNRLRVRPNGKSLVRNPDGNSQSYASADDSKTTEEIVVGCP